VNLPPEKLGFSERALKRRTSIGISSDLGKRKQAFSELYRCSIPGLVTMAGGMEVKKNKYIEEWGTARENLEKNFRWNRKNLAICSIFGLLVPYLVYKGTVRDFHMQDEAAGRPPRKFIF